MAHNERLNAMAALHNATVTLCASDKTFAKSVGGLAADLKVLHAWLSGDEERWRNHRSLHAVHVPAMTAAIAFYRDVDMSRASPEEISGIFTSFKRSATLFSDAVKAVDTAKMDRLRIEIETLAERAAPIAEMPEAVSQPVPAAPTSFFGRARASMPGIADVSKAISGVQGFSYATGLLSGAGEAVTSRASAASRLGSLYASSIAGSVVGTVVSPVSSRLAASQRAIESGLTTGAVVGITIGILFPPLLPLTAGVAVASAMGTYSEELDRIGKLNAREREAAQAKFRDERSRMLLQLSQGAGALQLENEMISVTVDTATGAAEGVVLDGAFAGRNVRDLDPAEREVLKREVRKTEGGESIMSILALGAEAAMLSAL